MDSETRCNYEAEENMNRIRTILEHQITKIIVYVVIIWFVGSFIVYWCEKGKIDPETGKAEFDSFFKTCWNVVVYITSGFDVATPASKCHQG